MDNKLQRFFLEIAYDGTMYHGWQLQHNAISVQQKLNDVLETVLRSKIETTGAGRTDTGVHAQQLFVHFDTQENQIKSKRSFLHSLNALLPQDISAQDLIPVSNNAHARFDATERSYAYFIHFKKDPFLTNRSWQIRDMPDIALMNTATQYLLGKQDFSCFSKSHTQVFTNICTIKQAYWHLENDRLVFRITADRFLRNMVRAIVGTLIEIGIKKKEAESILEVIRSRKRSQAGISVPAHGLYLTNIVYPYL
ncbi:tRNA pseudouridine(38-40) synthase TruA [Sphingobacterium sp. UT-1RO-CII-1]|uniref:tRNA pseudouridine(38-40) synthase TruA n=1 Tax=Sphingobacterium sp. UT-1RO-CII-1 TaxID=2995225 RepID=UPI00227C6855|nr:tRNA pseudouridine(38-40) synthase TruA [Sphingobacterium sp. UT-1RO-CII-1]MCY4780879.1 tRNA pseudouridine(38-40) synthase TruA [Sphingobacterium sp. UT-1RO-CII-1]